jgi:hypothetical protein
MNGNGFGYKVVRGKKQLLFQPLNKLSKKSLNFDFSQKARITYSLCWQ